jgi:hypothetical protein
VEASALLLAFQGLKILKLPRGCLRFLRPGKWTGSVAQAVECLLCKREVLSLSPSLTKGKEEKRRPGRCCASKGSCRTVMTSTRAGVMSVCPRLCPHSLEQCLVCWKSAPDRPGSNEERKDQGSV